MQDCYINALILSPPVVLGHRLLDFSLYHYAVLDLFDSPYLSGGSKTIDDLALGVWVCSRTPAEIRAALQGGATAKTLLEMGKKSRRADFQKAGAEFQRYVTEYLRMPEWWVSDGSPRRVPFPFAVAWQLIRGGIPEERAWSMSLPLAMSYYAAEADAQGSKSVATDEELEAIRLIEQAEGVVNGGRKNTGEARD